LAVEHYPLAATIQPIPYPLNGLPIKSMAPQFREKDVVGDRVKGFTKIQIDSFTLKPLPLVISLHALAKRPSPAFL